MVERNQDGDDGSDLTRSDETQRVGEEKEQAAPREEKTRGEGATRW